MDVTTKGCGIDMADLTLALKREYFEAIKSGEKTEEYRLVNEYWRKRLEGRDYENVILTLGYPKKDDESRRLIRKWKSVPWWKRNIQHELFGKDPVEVYVIDIS